MKRWVVNSTHPLKQIVMTKKELLEAIKDMPENSEFFIDFETQYQIETKPLQKVLINKTFKIITLC